MGTTHYQPENLELVVLRNGHIGAPWEKRFQEGCDFIPIEGKTSCSIRHLELRLLIH
jgi:hypothetical protein